MGGFFVLLDCSVTVGEGMHNQTCPEMCLMSLENINFFP